MSYLALARKWRPRTFADVVGQPHIVRALTNALTTGRIHHAFLFAGTRGVGKTTVARILARCLNCETGITPEPCGSCAACRSIEEGRFVDLIEVDAASRTGVDDTRELLENVQYTPSAGRFKVYLIDEIHMLSKPAFNALLKTLEEPPPHVKFLFATTDPQKLPVTVLSRCLQFNLKRLTPSTIAQRMQHICQQEKIAAETGAITRLARAAAGSLRDALSLLDQAVAYGNETLGEADVAEMLGTLDRSKVVRLLNDLSGGNAGSLLETARELDELVPDYAALLDDIATALQRIAVLQIAGAEALEDDDEIQALETLARQWEPEFVQLLYQIAITSRRDLNWAPEPRLGFEMALLRMLAFRREGVVRAEAASPTRLPASAPKNAGPSPPSAATADDWAALVESLPLQGAARQLALHTTVAHRSSIELRLSVERGNSHLITEQQKARVVAALQSRLGSELSVRFELKDEATDSAGARAEQRQSDAVRRARETLANDPGVREFVDLFGAEVVPESIRPVGERRES
jgi:DNA polymerase-3 subunit gamma/tau